MKSKQLARILTSLALGAALLNIDTANSCGLVWPTIAGQTIMELDWMSGGWQTAPGKRAQVEEYWTRPAGASMIGTSRTIAGNKTLEFEYLRIEQRDDAIYYVASPNGRCPATDFKLTRLSVQEVVFENPQHDFPSELFIERTPTALWPPALTPAKEARPNPLSIFLLPINESV